MEMIVFKLKNCKPSYQGTPSNLNKEQPTQTQENIKQPASCNPLGSKPSWDT